MQLRVEHANHALIGWRKQQNEAAAAAEVFLWDFRGKEGTVELKSACHNDRIRRLWNIFSNNHGRPPKKALDQQGKPIARFLSTSEVMIKAVP